MLIKPAEAQSDAILELERRAGASGPGAKLAADDLRIRKDRLKGERKSEYLIDFDFANLPNWAVIYDLGWNSADAWPRSINC